MLLEKEVAQETSVAEVLEWLQAQMDARGIAGRIARDRVRERQDVYCHVLVPVLLDTGDAYDDAKLLSSLERVWNEREPAPDKYLFLYPGEVPDGVV
ncbi:MAG: hypothetical protein M3Y28_05705 [Armatimonadota bacterium]|nr:hypothetical protein [Armatimonadota bacterium]